jgi:hypothetical protein
MTGWFFLAELKDGFDFAQIDEPQTADQAAEVSEVRDVAEGDQGSGESDQTEDEQQVLGLEAERKHKEDHHPESILGINGGECSEESAQSSGRSDHGMTEEMGRHGRTHEMDESAEGPADEVQSQESTSSQGGFENRSQRIEEEQIQDEMNPIAVEELVGKKLPPMTRPNAVETEGKSLVKRDAIPGQQKLLVEERSEIENEEPVGHLPAEPHHAALFRVVGHSGGGGGDV